MKASAMKKEEAQRGREAFWGRKTAGRGGGITGVASSVLAEGAGFGVGCPFVQVILDASMLAAGVPQVPAEGRGAESER